MKKIKKTNKKKYICVRMDGSIKNDVILFQNTSQERDASSFLNNKCSLRTGINGIAIKGEIKKASRQDKLLKKATVNTSFPVVGTWVKVVPYVESTRKERIQASKDLLDSMEKVRELHYGSNAMIKRVQSRTFLELLEVYISNLFKKL